VENGVVEPDAQPDQTHFCLVIQTSSQTSEWDPMRGFYPLFLGGRMLCVVSIRRDTDRRKVNSKSTSRGCTSESPLVYCCRRVIVIVCVLCTLAPELYIFLLDRSTRYCSVPLFHLLSASIAFTGCMIGKTPRAETSILQPCSRVFFSTKDYTKIGHKI